MPRFGFFIQDVLPWPSDGDGDRHPGESLGCELALRHNKQGQGEVCIKSMVAGRPAALSGKVAIGDTIAEINGTSPLDDSTGSVQSLVKLTAGEKGTPLWLKIKGKGQEHVALLRQDPLALKPAPVSGEQGGLGFSFRDSKTKEGVDVTVKEIKAGGALWLAAQGGSAPIVVGDIITHVDGKPVTGKTAQFKGNPFSRILLAGRRGEDGAAFECDVVRMVTLPANSIAQVEAYAVAVACLPPAPPSDRVNGNAEIQMMAAPLINGLDIKAAAKIVIDAYILEEIQLQATTPAAEQPSSGSSTVLHPKSPGLSPMSPTTNLLNPLPMPLADDDTGKLDEDAPQDAADAEQAPEQDATSRGIGDRLSPTDIISTLSPELRFNAMAMVCAVAAPSLALHKKLRRQALREGDLPRVPDTRQEYIERKEAAEDTLALGGDALTNDSIAALDHHAAPLDEAPSDTCESEENKSSPNDVGKASRSKIQETAQAGPQILMASPNSVEQKESTSSWTFSGLKRAGNWVGGRGWGSDSPESTPSAAAKGLGIGMSPTADKSPTAEARKWSWGITAITASQSEEPGSPESPSKSRWGSWMRWNTEQSALQEPAVDKDESLLWHTEYVKFLSGFMVVDDGRASTLSSILNSKEKCSPFAAYILERATEFEKAEPHKKDLQVVDESMPKTGRTTSIVPECAAPESNESESEDDAEMDEVERTIKRVNKYEEKLKMLRSPKFNPMGRRMSLSLLDPDTLKPIKIPQMTSADEGKGGGGAVDEVPKLEKELSGDHAELEKQLCGAAICTPCTPGVQRQPWTICWLILAASVGSRSYDARSRSVIRHLSRHLLVPWQWIRSAEIAFCKEIIKATAPPPAEVKESEERYWNKNRMMRYGLIGGGAVAGGVVLAVTGGLAAPAIVAGLGLAGAAVAGAGVVGAGAASFAASVAAFGGLSTALGVSFGAAGAGLVGYKLHRRTGDIREFEFELIDCSPGLPVTIGVHGWLNNALDSPWKVWGEPLVADGNDGGESYAIRWESPELRALGQAISKLIESQAQSYAFGVAGTAVLGAAFATIALPLTIVSACDYVDNSWSIVQQRADKAGEQLARTLLARVHGNRPVTLIGYGMGARMIIKCLLELAQSPAGHGIVETCVLMGTPYPADPLDWAKASSVCSYRLVNAYNSRDWLLGFAYRATSANISGIAGLKEVEFLNGSEAVLENVDLTAILSASHFQWRDKLTELTQALGTHTGIVDLDLIKPDPDIAIGFVSNVKKSVPSLHPPSAGGFRETATSTYQSMKMKVSWLTRSSSETDLAGKFDAIEDEMASAELAAVMNSKSSRDLTDNDEEEYHLSSENQQGGSDSVPRPHSR